MMRIRRLIARSWALSRAFYWLRGRPLAGAPDEEIWYGSHRALEIGKPYVDSLFKAIAATKK